MESLGLGFMGKKPEACSLKLEAYNLRLESLFRILCVRSTHQWY